MVRGRSPPGHGNRGPNAGAMTGTPPTQASKDVVTKLPFVRERSASKVRGEQSYPTEKVPLSRRSSQSPQRTGRKGGLSLPSIMPQGTPTPINSGTGRTATGDLTLVPSPIEKIRADVLQETLEKIGKEVAALNASTPGLESMRDTVVKELERRTGEIAGLRKMVEDMRLALLKKRTPDLTSERDAKWAVLVQRIAETDKLGWELKARKKELETHNTLTRVHTERRDAVQNELRRRTNKTEEPEKRPVYSLPSTTMVQRTPIPIDTGTNGTATGDLTRVPSPIQMIRADVLQETLEKIEKEVAALNASTPELELKRDTVVKELQRCTGEIKGLEKMVEDMRLALLKERTRDLTSKRDAEFEVLVQRIAETDKLERVVRGIKKELETHNTLTREHTERRDAVQNELQRRTDKTEADQKALTDVEVELRLLNKREEVLLSSRCAVLKELERGTGETEANKKALTDMEVKLELLNERKEVLMKRRRRLWYYMYEFNPRSG